MLACYRSIFDWDHVNKKLVQLDEECNNPQLWDSPSKAQALIKERNYYSKAIGAVNDIQQNLDNINEYIQLAEAEGMGVEESIQLEVDSLYSRAKLQEVECLFSAEADSNDCFLEIHSGAGGTESDDWADILFRMYQRWVESHNFKYQIIDRLSGEEAGIKSATLKISGPNAYGWLKTESGVHRLVRISPFNAAGKRHTSFASVWIYPVVDDGIEIEIVQSDIRIDTYRSSGAGGQHVNTTDSAVRITHIPTGIVVQSQNNRSQHKNKEECFKMLKSRLYNLELQKRQETESTAHSQKTEIGWGHQIRSYVLHPYQMVKDLRTNYSDTNASGVLDGNLDEFLYHSLKHFVLKGKTSEKSEAKE